MPPDAVTYRFENFTLRPADRQLQHDGRDIVLRPKVFDTLLCLVQRHGHAVSKADLLDAVWPDVSVSEAVLTHCIAEVRQALGDERSRPRFVKTLSRHGYKFIASVETQPEAPGDHHGSRAHSAAAATPS